MAMLFEEKPGRDPGAGLPKEAATVVRQLDVCFEAGLRDHTEKSRDPSYDYRKRGGFFEPEAERFLSDCRGRVGSGPRETAHRRLSGPQKRWLADLAEGLGGTP